MARALEQLGPAPPGAIGVELAGGLGRHALELARQGYRAHLVDIAPEALVRAEAAAAQANLQIETQALDLDEPWSPLDALEGRVAVVVVTWFLLTEPMWDRLVRLLEPGGHVVLVHPTLVNLSRHPKPSRRFLVEPGAHPAVARSRGLAVVRSEEGWDESDRHTARLVARKAPARPGGRPW